MPPTTPRQTPSMRSLLALGALLLLVWLGGQAMHRWRSTQDGDQVRVRIMAGDIVMYTTDTCPYCARAKQWLASQSVPWRECNIDHDPTCRATFDARGAPGVPLMNVRGQWQLGFDPGWLVAVLKQDRAN